MADNDAIYQLGSVVPLKAYQAIIGVVLALAVLSYVARNIVKITTRGWHFHDEFLLAIAIACLIVCTALVYAGAFTFYSYFALVQQSNSLPVLPADIYDDLTSTPVVWFASVFAWSAIFCSKAHVLKSVWPALQQTPWLRWFSWGVLISNCVTWALLCASAFVLQPFDYFQPDTYFGSGSSTLFIAVNSIITTLDITTSSMVILILYARVSRHGPLPLYKTFVYGSWLALTLMAIFAILRVSRLSDAIHIDVVWMVLWHYLEAGVALIVLPLLGLREKATSAEEKLGKPDESDVIQR